MAKYNTKIVETICSLIRADSYTIAEVCCLSGISESTFHEWKASKPEFSECIKKAEAARMEFFVTEAKKSLLKKIQGYTVDESKTVYVDSKESEIDPKTGKKVVKPKVKEQTIIKKHIQPDTAAIIFTLTNGDPDNFKNRQSAEVTGKDGKDLFGNLTDEELDAKIADIERRLANGK